MPAKLTENSNLLREIVVSGVGPVIVELSNAGIRLRVKGSRKSVFGYWQKLIENGMETPMDVPAFLMGRPFELLRREAVKHSKKK